MPRPRLATSAAIGACALAVASIALAAAALASDPTSSPRLAADARVEAARELALVARRAAAIVGGQQERRVSSGRTVDELARADVSTARGLASQAGLYVSGNPTADELHALALAASDIARSDDSARQVAELTWWKQRVANLTSIVIVSLVTAIAFGLVAFVETARDRSRLVAAIPDSTPGASLPERMAWLAGRERRARAVADTVWRESRTLADELAESDERLRERERLLVEKVSERPDSMNLRTRLPISGRSSRSRM